VLDVTHIRSISAQKYLPEVGQMILALQPASASDLFGQILTVSQNQIGPGLVLHNMIWAVCRRTQVIKQETWQWVAHILPKPGLMIVKHWLAS